MGARVNENIKAIGDLGQVFLPRGLRKKYGLKPGALVRVVDTKDGISLKPCAAHRGWRDGREAEGQGEGSGKGQEEGVNV